MSERDLERGAPIPVDEASAERPTFEDGMAKLEAIVGRLESADVPLERALAEFEAGVALVRELNATLDRAEQRMEVLGREAGSRPARKDEEEDA